MWLRKKTQNLPTGCTSWLNPHDQLGRLCVYGIYERTLRIPTRENPLVLIAVDIGGKKHKGIGPDENLSCPHSRSRDQHSAGWHPREGRWTVTPARERNLTAVTQEKTFIIRMFVLQILLDFFSFFPPSVVVVNFISSMKSNSTFKLFFLFSNTFFIVVINLLFYIGLLQFSFFYCFFFF